MAQKTAWSLLALAGGFLICACVALIDTNAPAWVTWAAGGCAGWCLVVVFALGLCRQ